MHLNQEIFDRQVSHAIYLERYKTQLARDIIKLVKATESDVRKRLERRLSAIVTSGFDTGPESTRRLRTLLAEVRKARRKGFDKAFQKIRLELTEFAAYEAGFQAQLLTNALSISLAVNTPTASRIVSAVMANPMDGVPLREHVKNMRDADVRRINQQIRLGLVSGDTLPQIVRRVVGEGSVTARAKNDVEAVVRTAVNHASNQARDAFAKVNTDIVKGVMWVATLDTRTTTICLDLDGDIFPVDSGRRPPAHYRCRSTTTYITKTWREMGLAIDEIPAGTRASMDGQIPSSIKGEQWFSQQSKSRQVELFGKSHTELFRSGELQFSDLIKRDGTKYTLSQLRERHPDIVQDVLGTSP